LVWTWLLLAPGSAWGFYGGLLAAAAASVWICGEAERILGERDPGSVVLDEIVAVPLCFAAWVGMHQCRSGGMPAVDLLLHGRGLCLVGAVFVSFRFFDILKPWPVRQSQNLPGGWGVTVDDLLAAVYVCVVTLAGDRFWG
jgi:phosphatidylglycerophosphatase A